MSITLCEFVYVREHACVSTKIYFFVLTYWGKSGSHCAKIELCKAAGTATTRATTRWAATTIHHVACSGLFCYLMMSIFLLHKSMTYKRYLWNICIKGGVKPWKICFVCRNSLNFAVDGFEVLSVADVIIVSAPFYHILYDASNWA